MAGAGQGQPLAGLLRPGSPSLPGPPPTLRELLIGVTVKEVRANWTRRACSTTALRRPAPGHLMRSGRALRCHERRSRNRRPGAEPDALVPFKRMLDCYASQWLAAGAGGQAHYARRPLRFPADFLKSRAGKPFSLQGRSRLASALINFPRGSTDRGGRDEPLPASSTGNWSSEVLRPRRTQIEAGGSGFHAVIGTHQYQSGTPAADAQTADFLSLRYHSAFGTRHLPTFYELGLTIGMGRVSTSPQQVVRDRLRKDSASSSPSAAFSTGWWTSGLPDLRGRDLPHLHPHLKLQAAGELRLWMPPPERSAGRNHAPPNLSHRARGCGPSPQARRPPSWTGSWEVHSTKSLRDRAFQGLPHEQRVCPEGRRSDQEWTPARPVRRNGQGPWLRRTC